MQPEQTAQAPFEFDAIGLELVEEAPQAFEFDTTGLELVEEAPPADQDKGFLSDTGNLLAAGVNRAAQNVRELVGRIPVVGEGLLAAGDAADRFLSGKDSETLLRENEQKYQQNLTPEMRGAQQKLWWDEETGSLGSAWTDPRAYASGIIQSLPEMAISMGAAGRLAKGAYARALAKTGDKAAAAKAAARMATVAGGVSEGLLGGAETARQVRDQIAAMPLEQLQQSEAFQTLLEEGLQPEEARAQLAEDSATQGLLIAGAATGVFGGMGDRALANLLTGRVTASIGGRIAKGAIGEGLLEELPQSMGQQLAENYVMQDADPSRELGAGVLNAGLGGLATGAVMGGGLGAVATPRTGPSDAGAAATQGAAASEATFENTPDPAALPAPGLQGLPPPDPVFYADSQGNVQDIGPVRNVDGEQQPEPQARQWINPQNDPTRMPGGPGMDQPAPRGEPAPLAGEFQHGSRPASPGRAAAEPATVDAAPERQALPAPDGIVVDSQGNAQRGPTGPFVAPQPERPLPGGRGMDQQAPTAASSGAPDLEIRLRKNGKPFQGRLDARGSLLYRNAAKAGEQPQVVRHGDGWAVAVPKQQAPQPLRPASVAEQDPVTAATAPAPQGLPVAEQGREAVSVDMAPPASHQQPATPPSYTAYADSFRKTMIDEYIAEGVPPDVAERLASRPRSSAPIDATTGLFEGRREAEDGSTDTERAIGRAIEYVAATDGEAYWVSADIANLGGLNAHFNNVARDANKHYRALADIVRKELGAVGQVEGFRTGGDEFGALVIGGERAAVEAALERAQAAAKTYTRREGLDKIVHPKHPDDESKRGVGLHLGVSPIEAGLTSADVMNAADRAMDQSKKGTQHVSGSQAPTSDRALRDQRSSGAGKAPERAAGAHRASDAGAPGSSASEAGPAAADRVSDTPAETPAASQAGSDTESRYSLDTGPRPAGVDAAAVRQALAVLPELASIQVVQSFDDLPLSVRTRAGRDGVRPHDVRGVFRPDAQYLVADNQQDLEEAIRTAVHEMVGHQGIRGLLGDQLNGTLERIYSSEMARTTGRQRVAQIREHYASVLEGKSAAEQRLLIAEEIIAHLAESGDRPTVLQRVVSKIRELLRVRFPQLDWTYTDVLALIERSREWLRSQVAKGAGPKSTVKESHEAYQTAGNAAGSQAEDRTPTAQRRGDRGDATKLPGLGEVGGRAAGDRSGTEAPVDPSEDTRYSLRSTRPHVSEAFADLSQAERDALGKIAPPTARQRATLWFRERADRAMTKIRQGLVDRYAALKELDEKAHGLDFLDTSITSSAWVLARMAPAAAGALNAMMHNGRIALDPQQKVIGMREDGSMGLGEVLGRLGDAKEIERFFGWVAGNRAAKLAAEGRENLFTAQDIEALKGINRGVTEDGRTRASLYDEVFKEFQQYRDDVLAIAEQTGIISSENRAMWRDEFYVPFYRVMDEEAKAKGPVSSKGLSRQEAYKKLKGGKQNLNDLLENTLMNFHHLLTASLKNQAAAQTIANAERLQIARKVPEAARDPKTSTFVLEKGEKVWYEVDDALVFEALSSLADPGLNNFAVRTMAKFKRVFTNMTTITPQFIIANFLRDSMQAAATTPVSKNVPANMFQGLKSFRDQKTRAQMLASGGAFSFGHIYGADPEEVKAGLKRSLRGAKLLDAPALVPKLLVAGWDAYNEAANTAENANRAAAFLQNQDKGALRAAYEARDLMDFSQEGAWPAVRFLIRVVPFLNARLQGLDKLYRSGFKPAVKVAFGKGTNSDKVAAARFAAVTGTLALASLALYLANHDDEEYRKLEDWQKDSFWFFRVGDNGFFLPKPFEVGAISTLVERLAEQAVDDKATGKLFRERLWAMLTQTFSFSPVPQMFQPALDVYSNRDAFTNRPIESAGMERLSPTLRDRASSTAPAKAISSATALFGEDFALSPLQADHLIRGYLGQVGAWGAGLIDTVWRAASGESEPAKRWHEYQPIRRFYRDLGAPAPYDRYSTLFYEGLKESGRVYADAKRLQELGRRDEAKELAQEKRQVLAMRKPLAEVQKQLSGINARMDMVRRSEWDGERKRKELDRLQVIKSRLTERAGKRIEEARARE